VLASGLPASVRVATGVFAPVAERTVARSLLASTVEPRMLPKAPYSH
jgi:hypothetical protein